MRRAVPHQQGPRDWLRQTAGAAAPSGGSESHEVGSVGAILHQQGPRDWLRQTAGAAAPSGGRELREANDRGGNIHRALRKFVGAMRSASRYLATVRRAHSMPCSLSISEI